MKRKQRFPHVNKALKWARDVVAGRVPACKYVRLACEQQLTEMANKSKSFPYAFNKELGERACRFIEKLPHTKGEWAFRRETLKLEPWQAFVIICTFGWKRKRGGYRRYREVYIEIPRKNGKSAKAAGVGIYMFVADDEFGAEVYSGATNEKQAWEVFRPARLMVARTPDLREHFGVDVNAASLAKPSDGSRFEPVIGKPGDGASPSCSIVDEYHEHDSSDLYDTMITGMGARRQPLMFIITTAGANIEGPCYSKRQELIDSLEGISPDPELFGLVFTIDENDDWTDPAVLRKANPNMGVSVHEDYLLSQQQRAIRQASFTNTFKTKHLNVWVSAKTAFFNLESWRACEDSGLTIEQFEGQPAFVAVDLASRLDLAAMVRIFRRDICGRRHYYVIAPKFYLPWETVYENEDKGQAKRYQKWVSMGYLTVTDGAELDFRAIEQDIKDLNLVTPCEEIPLDPHGAAALAHNLEDEGLQPVNIPQNYTHMSEPMKELEAAIEGGRIHHDGNPILTWCIANVVKATTPDEKMIRPIKAKRGSPNKIDGAVALIMAIGRAMAQDESFDPLDDYDASELMM